MKYYYVVYECRDDKTGKWFKSSCGYWFEKDFNLNEMRKGIMEEEQVEKLLILNYIKMTKREYETIK